MRLLFSAVILLTLVLSLAWAAREVDAQEVSTQVNLEVKAEAQAQRERGADLYAEHCAVCHGATRQGLDEARLAFPEDHRRCESCHRPNNPPQMDLLAMHSRNAFSIGDAPALVGEGTLTNFPNEAALHSYLSATMPRPFPGSMSEQDYEDLSAFLLKTHTP